MDFPVPLRPISAIGFSMVCILLVGWHCRQTWRGGVLCYTPLAMEHELYALAQQTGKLLLRSGLASCERRIMYRRFDRSSLTEVAGSSAYYQGGVIAYDNAVKQHVLGVALSTLETAGAVSEPCAREMVAGIVACSKHRLGSRRLVSLVLAVAHRASPLGSYISPWRRPRVYAANATCLVAIVGGQTGDGATCAGTGDRDARYH